MAAATPTATTADSPLFDQLSAGLLQQVLQWVPQRERLTQCSLVSRAWAEAAALATCEVQCTLNNSDRIEVFNEWLRKNSGHVRSFAPYGMVSTELCSLVQQMQQLVVLHLRRPTMGCAVFQHVAAMQHLQDLHVCVGDTPGDSGATHGLPSSLTRLYISDQRQRKTQLLTNLQPLTSLQELDLHSCELSVSSASLGSMTQLQVLRLASCTLLPDNRQGSAALLRALQQLTCLQSLQLDDTQIHAAQSPPQLFSALTASSQLTSLRVAAQNEQPLAQGAVQHGFPAGRQLPQLKVLEIVYDCLIEDDEQQGWCVDGDDLAAIVSACPHLSQLHVRDVMPRGADIAPLLRLPPSCKLLAVGGDAFDDAAAEFELQLRTSEHRGRVCEQLVDICDHSPACWRARMQHQNAAQQAEIAQLQQQLADRDAQLAERDAQLADRDAQVQQLQQELAALRGV